MNSESSDMATVSRFFFFFFPPPLTTLQTSTTTRRPFIPLATPSPSLSSTSSSSKGTDDVTKVITSVSNPLVKHCVKLRLSSSYRRSAGSVIIVGLTPIVEIREFEREKNGYFSFIDQLILLEGADTSEELRNLSNAITHVSPNVMKKISGMQSVDSTQAIAIMKKPNSFCDLENNHDDDLFHTLLPSPYRLLVLDGIQDPGNLGTLIRSARAFKWDAVFLLNGCCDPFNEKAIRAARGASFQLPIISTNWSQLNSFVLKRNIRFLGAHPANDASVSLSRHVADRLANEALCLVLGSEGNGLSKEALEKCELISIHMEGLFESINVSVAGGIFLFMLQPENK